MSVCEAKRNEETRWAAEQATEITVEMLSTTFDDYLSEGECATRSMALFHVLISYLGGTAYVIVGQLSGEVNGYEAWRRLPRRSMKSKIQSMLTTVISVVNTQFPDDTFETTLAKWDK